MLGVEIWHVLVLVDFLIQNKKKKTDLCVFELIFWHGYVRKWTNEAKWPCKELCFFD